MERQSKGVWIPLEIWEDENLSKMEMLLFTEIDSFSQKGECFASNEHFAKFLRVSTRQIQLYLKSLKEKGYIETTLFYKQGTKEVEKRVIKSLFGYGRKLQNPVKDSTGGPMKDSTGGYEESYTTPHVESFAYPHEENFVDTNTYKSTNTIITNTTNKKLNKKKKSPSVSADFESEFEQLWEIYPRKIGKEVAKRSFIKARKIKKIPYETIINGLYRYINHLEEQGTDEQYITHGSTWLNQQRWEDNYSTTLNKKPKNATEYLKAKYGGENHESNRNRKIVEHYSEIIPELL